MEWAMAGAHLLPAERRAELFGPVAQAFEALREGAATMEQWYTIDNGLRLSEALIGLNIGNNLAPQIGDGRTALEAVGARLRVTGLSTCRAAELPLVREATELYEIQLGLCTQGEISKAVRAVQRKINGAGFVAQQHEETCDV
ncbi:hypothetical protein [Paraburkholderia domus]|uniref:hypothetical protein n=1 Tax=Paraburkholderia domus TaxID=2793075 RepID=UPI0019128D46|nr:hypothetical protein [Paraburkholderia domus]MBK5061808.1 hypothetical protein [Burkholderia sp. R-70199]